MKEITHHDLMVICEDLKTIDLFIMEDIEVQGFILLITARRKQYGLVTSLGKVRVFKQIKTLIDYLKAIPVTDKKIALILQDT